MCGIAGLLRRDGGAVDEALLRSMCSALAHRGPDAEGVWAEGAVGLAHRRLAIIDLSDRAAQPMTTPDGRYVIVYNGEVYNFPELRARLEGLGCDFFSRSDTEVVLQAYAHWGPQCIEMFNGIFALAVWDRSERELFLARDRYGVKPLYYYDGREGFVFASEVKAILQAAPLCARLDPLAAAEYLAFQNIFSDRTLFDGVRLLPPAHTMTVGPQGVRSRRYWDFSFGGDGRERSESQWREGLREAFEAAVERQLISDVPVGCYLSGGMDSGSITAVTARRIPRVMTFTGGFDLTSVSGLEAMFDERDKAEHMASELGTCHYEMVMHSGDMAWVLPSLVWHLEDLRVGMCWQNYYIAHLASKFVKVVLAGAGGDELFGGYPWRYARVASARSDDEFEDACYDYWQRLVREEDYEKAYTPSMLDAAREAAPRSRLREVLSGCRARRKNEAQVEYNVNRALYFEARTFLHGLFIVEDKLSMAHGMEARVPFLDNDLVDFATRIPASLKLQGLGSEDFGRPGMTSEGKWILRRAMSGLIPEPVLHNEKHGFSPPDGTWYRGPTMGYIRQVLLDDRALGRGIFRPEYVRRVIDEHTCGAVNHRLLIWSMLCLEWWHRIFIEGEVPARGLGALSTPSGGTGGGR